MDDFVGQQPEVERLRIAVQAAKERGDPLDHLLLCGPDGVGKATLARAIANELGVQFRRTTSQALERDGDLVSVLTSLELGDVLLVDAIHRLPRALSELLASVMEDFHVDIAFGARTFRSSLMPFTLVGTAPRVGLVPLLLLHRFGMVCELRLYSDDEPMQGVCRYARSLGVAVSVEAARAVASRSRGTMRVANRLVKRVCDYAQVRADGHVTPEIVDAALALEEVDALGLTGMDRRYLEVLVGQSPGGPVGIGAIAAALQTDSRTLESLVEPYLLQAGLIQRTPRGRVATELARHHLANSQPERPRQTKQGRKPRLR